MHVKTNRYIDDSLLNQGQWSVIGEIGADFILLTVPYVPYLRYST